MSCGFNTLAVTVLPFIYQRSEWPVHPSVFLKKYVNNFDLDPYTITHLETLNSGIDASILINGRKFISSTEFKKKEDATANIIILALLNIYGYYETASELQSAVKTKLISWKISISDLISKHRQLTKSEGNVPIIDRVGLMIREIILGKKVGEYITICNLALEIIAKYGIIVKNRIIRLNINFVKREGLVNKTSMTSPTWVVNKNPT